MHSLSELTYAEFTSAPARVFLTHYRVFFYAAVLLLAVLLVDVSERLAPGSAASGAASLKDARAQTPATTSARTDDDRPLLLPDR